MISVLHVRFRLSLEFGLLGQRFGIFGRGQRSAASIIPQKLTMQLRMILTLGGASKTCICVMYEREGQQHLVRTRISASSTGIIVQISKSHPDSECTQLTCKNCIEVQSPSHWLREVYQKFSGFNNIFKYTPMQRSFKDSNFLVIIECHGSQNAGLILLGSQTAKL